MFIQDKLISCFCYPSDRCETDGDLNNTCRTTTGCYTSRDIINGIEYITSGCFSNDIFQMQLTCSANSASESSLLCCSNEDFCNRPNILGSFTKCNFIFVYFYLCTFLFIF